jgi:hypothetical protein
MELILKAEFWIKCCTYLAKLICLYSYYSTCCFTSQNASEHIEFFFLYWNVIRNILNFNIHLKMAQFVLRIMAKIRRSKDICIQILHIGNNLLALYLHLSCHNWKHNIKTLLN